MSKRKPIRLAGAALDRPRHVCGFFNGKDDEYAALMPFIKEGFADGDRAFHSVDPRSYDGHLERLKKAGIDVEGRRRAGQLVVRTWLSTHLQDCRFDQDAMLALVEEALSAGRADGYPITRLVASMEWALEDLPGVHDIVRYESRFNDMIASYEDAVICTYDANRFGGDTIIDVLRTHPYALLGGVLQENPFYIPANRFLAELEARPR
jgi:hypothetical protein